MSGSRSFCSESSAPCLSPRPDLAASVSDPQERDDGRAYPENSTRILSQERLRMPKPLRVVATGFTLDLSSHTAAS